MIIKTVRTFTKEISKEELKKRSIQIGIVSLGLFLTLKVGFIEQKNTNDYNETLVQYEKELQEVYTLSSCKVLIENCPDGKIKHHFVLQNDSLDYISYEENENYHKWNYAYIGITDPTLVVPYSKIFYETEDFYSFLNIPETSEYIFDYKAKYYVMDIKTVSLPDGYSLDTEYSTNTLQKLEERLDLTWFRTKNYSVIGLNSKEKLFAFNSKNVNKTYLISNLCLLEIDGEYICFDKHKVTSVAISTNQEDVTKLKNVYYAQDIVNPFIGIKLSSGMNQIEERNNRDYSFQNNLNLEEITSLSKNMADYLGGKSIEIKDIYDYLTEEQILRGTISYVELAQIIELHRELKLHIVL